jgi:hypothetical protein
MPKRIVAVLAGDVSHLFEPSDGGIPDVMHPDTILYVHEDGSVTDVCVGEGRWRYAGSTTAWRSYCRTELGITLPPTS